MDWKNIVERAVWTFIEGFLVGLPSMYAIELQGAWWKSLLLAGIMGGLSAVKTFLIELIEEHKKKGDDDIG